MNDLERIKGKKITDILIARLPNEDNKDEQEQLIIIADDEKYKYELLPCATFVPWITSIKDYWHVIRYHSGPVEWIENKLRTPRLNCRSYSRLDKIYTYELHCEDGICTIEANSVFCESDKDWGNGESINRIKSIKAREADIEDVCSNAVHSEDPFEREIWVFELKRRILKK